MIDFPDVQIKPITLRAKITYEAVAASQDQIEDIKRNVEEALGTLRFNGAAKIEWQQ